MLIPEASSPVAELTLDANPAAITKECVAISIKLTLEDKNRNCIFD